MPWPSSSPSNVVEVVFCRTKCNKMAVIHQDYYFHHNRKYKGGDYWCCAQRGCKVRLISSRVDHETGRMEFSRRNKAIQHHHRPNAPNLIEKEFRRQLVIQCDRDASSGSSGTPTNASVRLVYDQLRLKALERGVPEALLPSFENVRSTVYRIRRKRESTQTPVNASSPEIRVSDNNATSAGEGSNSRSGSSTPESPSSSREDPSTSPEQTEPLCLVTWKTNNNTPEPQRIVHYGSQIPHTSPILLHTLQSPSSSGPVHVYQPTPRMQFDPVPTATDPNVLRYPSHFSSGYVPNLSFGQSEILEQYAAMHAQYLRSLIALNLYPRF